MWPSRKKPIFQAMCGTSRSPSQSPSQPKNRAASTQCRSRFRGREVTSTAPRAGSARIRAASATQNRCAVSAIRSTTATAT